MTNSLKVLHVASFDGNIGDNASHFGTYKRLRLALGRELEVTRKEIRKTYLNYQGADRWYFDERFIEEVNCHDLTLVGGGNYFELWVEQSSTGTTVDLHPDLLAKLNKPLVFNGVGCDPFKGYSEETIGKFRVFLETALANSQVLVSVRNDGSHQNLIDHFGDEMASRVSTIPDPGFFMEVGDYFHPEISEDQPYWVINLAVDMPDIRFSQREGRGDGKRLDYHGFIEEFGKFLAHELHERPEISVVLVPHIYSDLRPFNDLLQLLPDHYRRNRISVAPYLHGDLGASYLFDLYRGAQLTIGTRFHANVCPIGLGVPAIGLVTYRKLADLYDELGMSHRYLWASEFGYGNNLSSLVQSTVDSRREISLMNQQLATHLAEQADSFYQRAGALISTKKKPA